MLQLNDESLIRTGGYLGREWLCENDAGCIEVRNPATGDTITRVAKAHRADAKTAVNCASEALPAWSGLPAKERSRLLRNWFDLCLSHSDDLAKILTAEQGKPLAESRAEVAYGAAFLEWFSEEAKRIYGEIVPGPDSFRRVSVLKQPIGVCGAITPWNFPFAMITRKAAPALAVGCTMVVKPASATPLSALALMELAIRAGIPPGVMQMLPGTAETVGDELARNPLIRKLSFTGSTETGASLMKRASRSIKKLSLELGGNAPLIVFEDADVEAAVKGTIDAKFRNMGQTCVCANRIYVHRKVHDEFVEKLAIDVNALRLGNGLEDDVEQGPLIDQNAFNNVLGHVNDAVAKGATIIAGGNVDTRLGGTFFRPTILDGVTHEMKIAHEETFGPVAPVFVFDDEEEVIAWANSTEYGLAAYVFTEHQARLTRVTEALEFGIVGANTGLVSFEGAPFGGWKASGLGREGSRHGADDYLEIKYVCTSV